ncbi:TPA: type IV secretion system DNA-binding domain-containing protein, partial [Escherichia coli]|nr:type IV secretion system DNA-binding domain-containing protein [Escherichia coli]
MSSTKHITQGGQVFSYMLNMFMQVNKRVSFWLIWFFVIFLPLFFWLRLPWETIRNGGLYWWLSLTVRGEKALYRVPPVYDIPWNGQVLHATSEQILKDDYMVWAGNMFLQELYLALFWASVAVGVLAFLIFRFLRRLGEKQAQDERMGGRELTDDVKAVAREMHRRGQASSICIDQLPLILNGEVQYLMMYGTPGSGKSNTINKLLKQIRARGDMAIIYDKGCSLIKKHFNERDDTLLNALDRRCAYWDMFREFESIPDFDSAASTLIPMGAKEDPFWQSSARTIFSAVSYRQKKKGIHSYNALLRTLLAIDLKALRDYLAGTEASNLVEEKVEKTAISIRSVLTNYVKALRYLQGIERTGRRPFTIREWMSAVNDPQIKQHGWLWVTSNARQHESLKPLISMWLAQAANCLLGMGENLHRRVWFIYDELP